MKEYLMTLTAVALLGGILGMLSPEGDIKKYVRLAVSLCLVCAMIQPVLSVLSGEMPALDELLGIGEQEETMNYDEIYYQSLLSGGREQAEEAMKQELLKEFSLPYESLEVEAILERKNDGVEVKEIRVTLRDSAIFADPKEVIAPVNERLSCPCTVIYD